MKLRWAIAIAAAAVFAAVPALAGSTATPPVTGKIVYTSLKDGQADIYSMNADGKNVVNLTHDKTIGVRADVQPVWAPGGEFVAFERQYTKAGAELMVVKFDGTQLHSLIPTQNRAVWSGHPSWTSGNLIYFTSNRDGNFELYSISATGKDLTQLTHTKAPIQNLGPSVSPDGKSVVFSRTDLLPWGTNQLYLLNAGSALITRLTSNHRGHGDVEPAWAPNGKQIAFASDRMGRNAIWMINANGTNLIQVTHPLPTPGLAGGDVHPTFSPNGKSIAFVSMRTGATEIFTVGLPTISVAPPLTQLTFDRAFKDNPSWLAPVPSPN
jgi:Tol biopolymer transport system component